MRPVHLVAVIAIASSAHLAAQSKDTKPAPPAPKALTLTGCVAQADPHTDEVTIEDATGIYRLTGTDIRDFIGQRVQLVGGIVRARKIRIEGGLKPSANLAAQAGAIDPAGAAIATAGGLAPTGTVRLPEFRVKTIRPLGASCK